MNEAYERWQRGMLVQSRAAATTYLTRAALVLGEESATSRDWSRRGGRPGRRELQRYRQCSHGRGAQGAHHFTAAGGRRFL